MIIIVAYISVLIHSCSLLSSFIVARVYHQLVIEKPLVALSLKKTNSAFSVVIHCLQFFVWGWSKMRFPSYTLTHLLVMLLFKTCLGSQFFKISCVAFLAFLGDTLSQHIFWSFDFSVFLPIPQCSLSLSYKSCVADLSGMSGHHTILWDEKAPKVFSSSFHSVIQSFIMKLPLLSLLSFPTVLESY